MDRALELDPLLPEAHSARAKRAFFYERDWATAQAHFERALELRPEYAECRMFFAYYHAALGRRERALAEGRRATEDTPLFGLIQAAYALVQIFCGQVEEGVEQARRALTIEPGNAVALRSCGSRTCSSDATTRRSMRWRRWRRRSGCHPTRCRD